MGKITAIIIEDEKPSARKLQKLLSAHPEIEVLAVIETVQQGIEYLSQNTAPQIIFSDIVLGDGLSFDIFEHCPIDSFIVFTTAYDDYTLKAFKLNSIDYLLKPIDADSLSIALQKYRKIGTSLNFVLPNFKAMIREEKPKLKRILVKIGYQIKILNTQDIVCFYSHQKIVYAQTMERAFPTDFSLEELEQNLDANSFFRTNRQVIVQLSSIKNIHTSPFYKLELIQKPEVELTVSRERVKDFKDWLKG